jgi:hypothetical protein
MAVGRSDHLPTPFTRPSLSVQLLAGIQRKAVAALGGGLPDIPAWPDGRELQNAIRQTIPTAEQQAATLFRGNGP